MTLKSKLFVFKLLMSFSLIGQELEAPQNLFYCSQAYSINQLWPISNSYFLGNIKYQSGKYVKNDLILLFNENHLVVDSLVITSGFINNVSIFKDNYFSIATSLKTTDYIIDSDKIVEIKTTPNQGGAKIFSGDMSDVILANYQGLTFGYTTKAKDRTKKRDKKNIPRFYYQHTGSKEKNWINPISEPLKGDQWKSFQERDLFALGEVIHWENKVYFSIPMVGKCYVFDLKTKLIDQILFPEGEAKSWYFTIDRANGKKYLIGDKGKNLFDIFYIRLDGDSPKKHFVTEVEGFFDIIFADQALLKENLDFENGSQECYFLKNIYEN
tara:strand:- start:5597 stop:6574 length:978 start_codon:yes stop_codon:yes gene_type:complete